MKKNIKNIVFMLVVLIIYVYLYNLEMVLFNTSETTDILDSIYNTGKAGPTKIKQITNEDIDYGLIGQLLGMIGASVILSFIISWFLDGWL